MDHHDLSLYKDVCSRFLQYSAHVVRNLRALPKTQTTTTLLDAWLNIASALGVDDPEEGEDVDSFVCSWKECHGLERPAKMKQCSRCKLTRYCGSNCQRRCAILLYCLWLDADVIIRDWIEGDHKGECGV